MCVCVCVYAEVNPKWHSSCDIYLVLKTRPLLLFYGTFQLGRAACQWVPWIGISLPPSTIDLYPFPTLLLGFWESNSGLHDCSGKYFMDWNTCPALPRNFYSSVMIASHVHFLEPRKVQKILFGGLLWGPRKLFRLWTKYTLTVSPNPLLCHQNSLAKVIPPTCRHNVTWQD